MTEAPQEHLTADDSDAPGPTPGPGREVTPTADPTGHPEVDAVLDSLDGLDQLPVSEHVAVFEAAHDRLRGALATAGEPPTPSSHG